MQQNYRKLEGTLGKDLLLDQYSDLVINNNDLETTIGKQGVFQRLLNKIKSFYFSLFAHEFWGGYFQSLISKNMTTSMFSELETVGLQQFLEEPEVIDVPDFSVIPHTQIHLAEIKANVRLVTDVDTDLIRSEFNL